MKKVFKDLKEKQEQQQQVQNQQKQQEIDQQQKQSEAQLEQAQQQHQADLAHQDYQNELDRINKKEIAVIMAESKTTLPDVNNDNIPDVLEISQFQQEQTKAFRDYQLKLQQIHSQNSQHNDKMKLERDKIQAEKEKSKNDIEIAKIHAKNKGKK